MKENEKVPLTSTKSRTYGSTESYKNDKRRKKYVIPPGLDKLYQEQLDKAEWSEDTVKRLYTMGALRRMFERRWLLEDLTAFLALLGIILGLLLDQHMFRMMEWTGRYDYDPYKDSIGRLFRFAITVDTMLVLGLIYHTATLRVKTSVFRGVYPSSTTLFTSKRELCIFFLECFFCALVRS